MKKFIGALCVILSLPFFTVGVLAATNMPIPFLGPLLGYNPTKSSSSPSSSASSASSASLEDDFYSDDDPLSDSGPAPDGNDASSVDSADDVIHSDDDDDTTSGQSVTSETSSEFMKALEVVASTVLFKDRFTFVPATYVDGDYVAMMRFPDDSEFTVTESQTDGIYIENVFSIQSSITLDEYDILTDREAHMAYVYETVMQALGKNVGVGAEEYNTIIVDDPLFPAIETEPVFDNVKDTISSKTLSSDNFNLTITDLVPDEFFISGRLLLSLKNSTSATIQGQSSSTSEDSETSSAAGDDDGVSSSQIEETSSSTSSESEKDDTSSIAGSSSASSSSKDQNTSAQSQSGQDSKNNPRAGNRALQGS